MSFEIYHQLGYNYVWNFDSLKDDKAGDGVTAATPSIAFEMKLSDWRRGLIQAFKYRTFARVVYLVLDGAHIGPALKNSERFERSNVGLIGIETDGGFQVYHTPEDEEPFCPELADRFVRVISSSVAGRARPARSNAECPLDSSPSSLAPVTQCTATPRTACPAPQHEMEAGRRQGSPRQATLAARYQRRAMSFCSALHHR